MAIKDLRIHLPTVYGSSYEDMGKTVLQKYGTQYQSKLQWAWGNWKFRGLTAAQFEAMPVTAAEVIDAAWTQEAPNNLASGYQNTYTQAILPKGKFTSPATINIPRGGMIGEGCFSYNGQGGDQGQVATEFVMLDNWIGSGSERRLFETPNANTTGNMGYNECFVITGVRATGPYKFGDGINRIGWFIRKPGSATWINQVQANGFQRGFVNIDGVPVTYGTITTFSNEFAGFSAAGTALATINIMSLEGDGNARLFEAVPGYGLAAGGKINIGLLKCEDGITAGVTIRNQIAAYLEGQYNVNIGITNFSNAGGSNPEAMFVVNPTLGGGANQKSLLRAQVSGFGYTNLLKNKVTGSVWTLDEDYAAAEFRHYASGDGLFTDCKEIAKVGGTPTPPVDPVPSTGLPVTIPAHTNTSSGAREVLNIAGVRKVTFTGLKWNGPGNPASYPFLLGIGTNGGIQLNAAPNSGQLLATNVSGGATFSQAKLTAGATVTLTITFAQAQTIATLFNPSLRNDAFQGSWLEAKVS